MTHHDLIDYLNDLINGERHGLPGLGQVDRGRDGRLVIEADGRRFDIIVRPAEDNPDEVLDPPTGDDLAALGRSIDEAEDEAERDGTLSYDDLRRSLEEARVLGLRERERRRRA